MATTPLQTSITLDLPCPPPQHRPRHILIYFIPGNPGLIEFYRPFLQSLHSALSPLASTGTAFTIVGDSLANFHTTRTHRLVDGSKPPCPLNLKEMIKRTEFALTLTASPDPSPPEREPTEVILIGHSVGAYIMMSMLARQQRTHPIDPTWQLDTQRHFTVLAGIGLFPTIVDLYASPLGRKASWLAHIPGLSLFLSALAKLLTSLLPFTTLVRLVQALTHQPAPAAHVTASFLSSPRGVRQAVYLAQHELLEMREDVWDDEVWTTTAPSDKPPLSGASDARGLKHALHMYFGSEDHWIANSTRDKIIATRRKPPGEPGPEIEIDVNGLPHDFCVREDYSAIAAGKVAGYVAEVIGKSA